MPEKNVVKSPKAPFETPLISVSELFWNQLKKLKGETVCIIDSTTDTKLTINELVAKSQCFAKALIQRGVNKSDMILTFAENSIEHVIALTTGIILGLTLYPISPIANIYEMDSLLGTLGSLVIITSKAKSHLFQEVLAKNKKINAKVVVVLDGVNDNYLSFPQLLNEAKGQTLERIPYFSVDPLKDVFILLQSSGTSGFPKSVMHSHHTYANMLISSSQEFKEMDDPVYCHLTPFGCLTGSLFLIGFVMNGISIVIYRPFSEELFFKSIGKYKIKFVLIVPALGPRLLQADKYDLSSLKMIFAAGAAIPAYVGKELEAKYNLKFREGYGMTEYGGLTDWGTEEVGYIPGSLGTPARNTEIKIIDIETGENLGPDMDGEICVRGPTLFIGYLNNPSATAEAIDSNGWLRTGDIGHYDRNNHFFITDRLKELIKFGTKQVSPSEIEQFLLTHECIAEVAVVGVKHQTQSQWPRAYVKVKDNMSVTEDEIKKYVSDNLNEAKELRAGVVFVDSIPRTTIGKVDRRHFKQLIKDEIISE